MFLATHSPTIKSAEVQEEEDSKYPMWTVYRCFATFNEVAGPFVTEEKARAAADEFLDEMPE